MREILDIQEQVPSIGEIAARTGSEGGYNFSGDGRPEEWKTVLATGNLFSVLGVPLSYGRRWPARANRDRDFRVILTYGVWRGKFGGSRAVLGRQITLDHAPGYTIEGVAGENFDYPSGIQVYRSLGGFASYDRPGYRNVIGVVRLKPGIALEQCQSQLDSLSRRLAAQLPASSSGLSFRARSMKEIYSGSVQPYPLLLLGAVLFVLLISVGNVANLMLARALQRDREIAVRLALGAGTYSMVRQLVVESFVLALLSCFLGLGLCFWWMRGLHAVIGAELPAWLVLKLDGRVLLVTLAVSPRYLQFRAEAFNLLNKTNFSPPTL
jgi:putative ABC transport system permease protein